MHSIVTTFRAADIKVEVANFCAAMDTLIGQDEVIQIHTKQSHEVKMIFTLNKMHDTVTFSYLDMPAAEKHPLTRCPENSTCTG